MRILEESFSDSNCVISIFNWQFWNVITHSKAHAQTMGQAAKEDACPARSWGVCKGKL